MDAGRDDDWEGLCPGDPVPVVDKGEQLAKRVAVGLTSTTEFVMVTGTNTVESPPVHLSI